MIELLIFLYIIKAIVFYFVGKKVLKIWRERKDKRFVYSSPVEEL
jgi:hypothetical protein